MAASLPLAKRGLGGPLLPHLLAMARKPAQIAEPMPGDCPAAAAARRLPGRLRDAPRSRRAPRYPLPRPLCALQAPTHDNVREGKVAHPELLNENLRKAQYAVRGELYIKAMELQAQGRELIFTNGARRLGGARGCAGAAASSGRSEGSRQWEGSARDGRREHWRRGGAQPAARPPPVLERPRLIPLRRPSPPWLSLPAVGNPQQLGQLPITFNRQVLSLMAAPFLLDHPSVTALYPKDAVDRARALSKAFGPVGAYTDSRGSAAVRKEVADFIAARDGYPANPEHIFLTGAALGGRGGAGRGGAGVLASRLGGDCCHSGLA